MILACGAVNTPQLLMLSGVGPGAMLAAQGIGALVDNPNVGAHLNDHQGLNYTYRMKVPTLNDVLRPWWGKAWVGVQYLLARRGPLAKSINAGGGFFRTDPGQSRPNMQLYMQAFSTLLPKPGERPILTPDPFPGMSLGLSNCRPTSRGRIELASADPLAPPRIVQNAYGTDQDVADVAASFEAAVADTMADRLKMAVHLFRAAHPEPWVATPRSERVCRVVRRAPR